MYRLAPGLGSGPDPRQAKETVMSELLTASLRALVQERAHGRCEYCLLHKEDAILSHEPDHIVASKHRGKTHEDNLAWTCFACNRHKGSDLASINYETGRVVRLFNPRTDKWARHFRLEGALIVPMTPKGRVTEYLLQLNNAERVERRNQLIAVGRYPR
jgi:hypothetical protein